jgi:hypothetical protein
LLRNQSSALLLPPGVAGDAIEAGLPRLAMLRPPPGVAGLRMLFVSDDEAMLSPPGLPASPSEPLVLPLLEKAAMEEEEEEAAATAAWR